MACEMGIFPLYYKPIWVEEEVGNDEDWDAVEEFFSYPYRQPHTGSYQGALAFPN